jgi:surface antigen
MNKLRILTAVLPSLGNHEGRPRVGSVPGGEAKAESNRVRSARHTAQVMVAVLGVVAGMFAGPVSKAAAVTCSLGGGQVRAWNLPSYSGGCDTFDFGLTPTPDLTIRSFEVGGGRSQTDVYGTSGTHTFYPMVRLCSGSNYTGLCERSLVSDPDPGFDGISLKVQPYRKANYFPTAFNTFKDSSGKSWTTRTCTWGAAQKLYQTYGIYPAWGGNATDWDTNAGKAFYVVNQYVAVNTIVVQNATYNGSPTAFWRYSGFTAGVGPTGQYMHVDTNPLGHVGWAIGVAQDSSGNFWVHTIDTNFHPSDPDAWGRTTDPDGNTWVKEWIKLAPGMSFIHPIG